MNRLRCIFFLIVLSAFACRREEAPVLAGEVAAEALLSAPTELLPNPGAPLTATAHIRTKAPTTIAVEVLGAVPWRGAYRDSIVRTHRVPVIGLYAGRSNAIVLRIEEPGTERYAFDTLLFQPPPLPDYLPEVRIDAVQPNRMEPGWTLCELNIGGQGPYRTVPIAFDRKGVIRWYVDLGWTGGWTAPFEPLRNGRFLFAHTWGFFEYDWSGVERKRIGMNGFSQHHDAIEKPNGNLLAPATKIGADTWGDYMVEVYRDTGSVVRTWDLQQVLDVDRYDLIRNRIDWLHVNSVWYDERDGGLIVSARHQGVFKVSGENELRWILAPHRGWGKSGPSGDGFETAGYLLTAVDAQGQPYPEAVQQGATAAESPVAGGPAAFRWPWGQHAAMLLPNGHLLLYDNGWHRGFDYDEADFNRIVEYEIDEEARTVRQVWQYGEERGPALYSSNISDVDYLPRTGNRLLISGNIEAPVRSAKVVEVAYPSGQVVFEATVLFKNRFATGTGWEAADMIYRGERVEN